MTARNPRERFEGRLKALNRRADYLKGRIANYSGKDASYDKQELSAIIWAIQVIEENPLEALNVIKYWEKSHEEKKEDERLAVLVTSKGEA